MSVPGRIGSHQSALDAAVENRGFHDDQPRPARQPFGELGDLRREYVLAQMRADQHDGPGVGQVQRFGRAQRTSKGERIADVARPPALCEGRLG
jgi:hypothetical protein